MLLEISDYSLHPFVLLEKNYSRLDPPDLLDHSQRNNIHLKIHFIYPHSTICPLPDRNNLSRKIPAKIDIKTGNFGDSPSFSTGFGPVSIFHFKFGGV